MFTGLIETIGRIGDIRRAGDDFRIRIESDLTSAGDVELGESIAVNGVCLTVVEQSSRSFDAQASPETLSKTNLGRLERGSAVNLERALRLGDRLGGHMVLGHVDGVGQLDSIRAEGNASIVRVTAASTLLLYLVPKGSIAMDGISLTVNNVDATGFDVAIVPWTSTKVSLLERRSGWPINLEVDILGKYVARLLQAGPVIASSENSIASAKQGVSLNLLKAHGFLNND